MAEVWFKGRPEITFHDPLAAATIFEPQICTYRPGLVSVEYQSDRLFGLTSFDANAADKPHRIAVDVSAPRFFEHYFATVGG
jgi:inosine-uridine nucleoside N-ribohydrolase